VFPRILLFQGGEYVKVGVGLWMVYGFRIGDVPLVAMNILPLGANIVLVAMKLQEDRGNAKTDQV